MPDDGLRMGDGWVRVRFGHRILRARRLKTGNWHIESETGWPFAVVNNGDFMKDYEKLPADYQGAS